MQNQSISLTQEQRLQMILAPQLRQSLELLQAPLLELQTLIRAEAETNPTLEVIDSIPTEPLEVEPNVERDRIDEQAAPETADGAPDSATSKDQTEEPAELDFSHELDLLAHLDADETNYFFQNTSSDAEERRQYHYDSITQAVSLQEHLMEQLGLSDLPTSDREIGEMIIGSIDDHGYLVTPPDDLAESAGLQPAQVRAVLTLVQSFDPAGIGAADLRECLLLQLQRMDSHRKLEQRIVEDHLDLLAAHRFNDMARRLKAPLDAVQSAAEFIATLHPRPGDLYSSASSPVIMPEIIVRRDDEGYRVDLNDDFLPKLRISRRYERLLRNDTTDPEVKKYIAERIRSAAFMINSIGQRQTTLRRISEEIVRVQTPFFDDGLSGLKPLTMSQVADSVGVHETTISRAVAGKYADTPRGVFDMKFFFSTAVKTRDGASVSNKFIQDRLAEIIRGEDSAHPLSDQELVARLKADGYPVSRRTVNKYRTILKIPPSHLRRTGR